MTVCGVGNAIGGRELKRLLGSSIESFKDHIDAINRLNVFPVPDGDTGINMFHTLRRAYEEIAPLKSDDASVITRAFADGALMGARGNSGTILSQLIKGFAEGLEGADRITSVQFSFACEQAVTMGYAAVTQPVEGTILTVAREGAASISQSKEERPDLSAQCVALLHATEQSLLDTPNRLPILKQAGVVDAGAMGLVVFLKGIARMGDAPIAADYERKPTTESTNPATQTAPDRHYGYDVQFLMVGQQLDLATMRRDFERIGWSVLVVGDETMAKVHIHVDNPADPLDYAIKTGAELDDIVVENMQAQYRRQIRKRQMAEVEQNSAPGETGVAVLCVAQGTGLRNVFHDLGCSQIIAGGQGENPSVEAILETIGGESAREVIVLPNNRNIILAARQAADLAADKRVGVVPTTSVMQGIAAMLAFADLSNSSPEFDTLLEAMDSAAEGVSSLEITRADRSGRIGRVDFKNGDFIAIVDGEMRAAAPTVDTVIPRALRAVPLVNRELATVYYGEGVTEAEAVQLIERLSNAVSELEFELVYGGQALYPFLIGVE